MKETTGALGKTYLDREVIIKQGDVGNEMHVIQDGRVEVVRETPEGEVKLGELDAGEFVGEMSLFDRETRSATVRAIGNVRIITIDKKNFMTRVHQDPSLAFRLVEIMSRRIRESDRTIQELNAALQEARSKF